MTDEENQLAEGAIKFVKTNKNLLIQKFANPAVYESTKYPVSLFMAGSPGAGKTEVSKRLIEKFESRRPIRIDPDEIREILPGYTGSNSSIFQVACSIGVEKLHDYAIAENINLILDGTFSSEQVAFKNIQRSFNHSRKIEVYYIYQDPLLAWKFTQIREAKEGRRISKEVFVHSFIGARVNVNKAKAVFKDKIELNLIIKNFKNEIEKIELNIINVDAYLPYVYTVDNLNSVISV